MVVARKLLYSRWLRFASSVALTRCIHLSWWKYFRSTTVLSTENIDRPGASSASLRRQKLPQRHPPRRVRRGLRRHHTHQRPAVVAGRARRLRWHGPRRLLPQRRPGSARLQEPFHRRHPRPLQWVFYFYYFNLYVSWHEPWSSTRFRLWFPSFSLHLGCS